MIYRTMTAKEDYSLGELGLMLDDVHQMDYPSVAMEGRLIAHDILEHQNGLHNIGSIGDELEAVGAVWHVRGRWGDIIRDNVNINSSEQHLASDICNMAMIFAGGVGLHFPVPRTYSHSDDETFEHIMELGRMSYRSEMESQTGEPVPPIPEYFDACLHYMRSGYNKSNRRFGSGFRSNNLFWEIAEAVDPYAKHVEFEGQRFRLGYDNNRVLCYEIIEDEYYL